MDHGEGQEAGSHEELEAGLFDNQAAGRARHVVNKVSAKARIRELEQRLRALERQAAYFERRCDVLQKEYMQVLVEATTLKVEVTEAKRQTARLEEVLFHFVERFREWKSNEPRKPDVQTLPSTYDAADHGRVGKSMVMTKTALVKGKFKNQKGSASGTQGRFPRGVSRATASTSKDGGHGRESGHSKLEVQGSYQSMKKPKAVDCFVCQGNHFARDCPYRHSIQLKLQQEVKTGVSIANADTSQPSQISIGEGPDGTQFVADNSGQSDWSADQCELANSGCNPHVQCS